MKSVDRFCLLIDYILFNVPINTFRSYGGLTIPNKRQNNFFRHLQQKWVFIVPDLFVMVLHINNHVDVLKGFIQKYPVKCEILRNIDTHAKFVILIYRLLSPDPIEMYVQYNLCFFLKFMHTFKFICAFFMFHWNVSNRLCMFDYIYPPKIFRRYLNKVK